MSEYPTGAGERPGQSREFQDSPQSTVQHARSAAGEVADTAKGQTREVAAEAGQQARQVVDQLRGRVGDQAQHQSRRAAQGIRQWAEDLASMSEGAKPDSPVSGVVRQVADGGQRAADYLDQHGLTGVVQEVQSFARRRPGAFLAGAAAAGFLIGRIAKASGGATSTASGGATSTASPETGNDGSHAPGASAPGPAATASPVPPRPPVAVPDQPLTQPPAEPYRTRPITPQEPREEFDGFGAPATPGRPGGEIR